MSRLEHISYKYGKEVFEHTSIKVNIAVVSPPYEEEFPGKGTGADQRAQVIPSSIYPEINGLFYSSQGEVPEGTIYCIKYSKFLAASPYTQAAVYLRVRAEAARLDIHARLSGHRKSLIGPALQVFTGRVDILSVDDLAILGVTVPKRVSSNYLNMDEIAEAFDIEETGMEIAKPPVIEVAETTDGVKVIIAQRPSRKVRLRSG